MARIPGGAPLLVSPDAAVPTIFSTLALDVPLFVSPDAAVPTIFSTLVFTFMNEYDEKNLTRKE